MESVVQEVSSVKRVVILALALCNLTWGRGASHGAAHLHTGVSTPHVTHIRVPQTHVHVQVVHVKPVRVAPRGK